MERIDELNCGNLKIIQDDEGFCFGIDSVLLANFASDIKQNSKIIDLGTGTGIISLLLSQKVNPKKIIAVELQEEVANMAKRTVQMNNLQNIIEIINEDIKNLEMTDTLFRTIDQYKQELEKVDISSQDNTLLQNSFDIVITNPPYRQLGSGIECLNIKNQLSRYESSVNLKRWISVSSKLLKDNGSFYIVYRPERISELLYELKNNNLEPKRIRFVYSKVNKEANLILLKSVKNSKPTAVIEEPLIIYNENGEYTDEIKKLG